VITRILEGLRLLSLAERLLVCWVAAAPFLLGGGLLVGAYAARWAGVLVFVAYFALAALALAVIVRRRLRLRREFLAAAAAIPGLGRGLLAHPTPAWSPTGSARIADRDLVRRVAEARATALYAIGARTRSAWLREPLAWLASNGRLDYAAISALFEPGTAGSTAAELMLVDTDVRWLLPLARLVAGQELAPGDAELSETMLRHIAARADFAVLDKRERLYVAERLAVAGRLAEAVPIVSVEETDFVVRALKADLLNPFGTPGAESSPPEELWLAAFNGMLAPVGLEPVELLPVDSDVPRTPFQRLTTSVSDVVSDGPLVSVVMTCHRPDEGTLRSVHSMIAQTWQNWELLVADDASPAEFAPVLERIAGLDPRIRVLRTDRNVGTYSRRNEAVAIAGGEFVAVHDPDDWAHPRRLELQARHLLAHPGEVANDVESSRVSENLRFAGRRRIALRTADSSLFFRREQVLDRVGFFDGVRAAADGEFRDRLEIAFGRPVPVVRALAPVVLTGFSSATMGEEELGDDWVHPARFAYRSARAEWHADIRAGHAAPRLGFPLTSRPFAAPQRLLERSPEARRLDVLVVLDARAGSTGTRRVDAVIARATALATAGRTVGLLHLESLEPSRSAALDSRLQRLVNAGTIDAVLQDDPVRAALVVVQGAAALQIPPSTESGLSADRVVIVDPEDAPALFTRADAEREATRLFGVRPDWISGETVDYQALLVEQRLG